MKFLKALNTQFHANELENKLKNKPSVILFLEM